MGIKSRKRSIALTGQYGDERGFAVPIIVAIIAVVTILGVSGYYLAAADLTLSQHEEDYSKAVHVAEAGVNEYVWHMNKDENYYKNYSHPAEGQDGEGKDNWVSYSGGDYHLDITPTSSEAPGVIVEATGRVKLSSGKYVSRKVKAQIKKRSFVNYIYITDHETFEGSGQRIWFISGDTLHGPLHSNDIISIDGNPVFEDRVTSAKTIYERFGSNPDFQQGYEESVTPLDFPPANTELKLTAQVGGYYYYGETTITLNSYGTITVVNNDATGQTTGPTGTVSLPSNGVIYVDGQALGKGTAANGDIYMEGILSGRLTIASSNDIYISGDLTYADSNEDMLGLVANNNIYILHYQGGQDVAPYNIEINAAVFALNHSFTFEDYARSPAKGTITIRGSIIQRFRGPVGTFYSGSGSKASGYSKDYWYDERMLYNQPPHFIEPLNSGFERVFWEEEPVN